MITKMKKVLLVMPDSSKEIDADLSLLGQLGVMHVSPYQEPKDESIERVDARVRQLERAISILDRYDDAVHPESSDNQDFTTIDRGEIKLMDQVLDAEETKVVFENERAVLIKDKDWYQRWGNITQKDIDLLKSKGVYITLYQLDKKDLKKIQNRDDVKIVGSFENWNLLILISEDKKESLDFQKVEVPYIHFNEVEKVLEETIEKIAFAERRLNNLHASKPILHDALEERLRRLKIRNFRFAGIEFEKQVRFWKGYIPVDEVDGFLEVADKHRWGYVVEEPTSEELDEVPTLIKTPKWADRVRPVLSFMGLVPGYQELDVSKVFLLFFTFFAGILVGDAGYGLVFVLLTFLVHWKQKFVKNTEFQLMYTLSASIMIWGTLTGTYFGSEAIADISVLSALRVQKLASFGGDTLFIQKFMFLIGAIHLTIGHLQVAWKYINSVKAIAQLGWTAIIWGLYLIVNQMVLGISAPGIMIWLFVGGAVLVAFFSNPGMNFFKGILSSLGNLPLSIINGFSDIISYIRLYAVGLSTVLMATSFNEMAIGDGVSTLASGIGAVIILILGHTLNMILAAMAILVHGVRLNMLEYAGHAGVEFSGSEYNPFRIKNRNLTKK